MILYIISNRHTQHFRLSSNSDEQEIKTVLKNRRKHRGTKAPFKQTFRSLFAVSCKKSPLGTFSLAWTPPNRCFACLFFIPFFPALSLGKPFSRTITLMFRRGVPSFRIETKSTLRNLVYDFRRSNVYVIIRRKRWLQQRHSNT